ncbi:helix-turn-helix domain-containing protein [Amnibacterium kyonggiense]|uniref:Excisionase family DNA binding protein n=1 Tax=Amnibacterium kyonggiense TaxID=595671 RepID=A0A4V3EAX9_9MICO|nr:helix-turn-helix domain-containing protein [Amnibacterium kyonggiense]TDS79524.1 excisionase family DNA binding protein [Amnibacterium kyonggiense]
MTASNGIHGVVLPPRLCLWLERNTNLTELRGRTRGDDPVIDGKLLELRSVAMAYRDDTTTHTTSTDRSAPLNWLTPREAAARARIAEDSICAAIRRNRLPAERIGRRLYIHPADLAAYLGRPRDQ